MKPENVPGWLFKSEGSWLEEMAARVPYEQAVVDLGTCYGRSCLFMARGREAATAGVVWSVDTYLGSLEHKKGGPFELPENLEELARENVRLCGLADLVILWKIDTLAAAKRWKREGLPEIGLLFCDASHEEQDVSRDLMAWVPLMADNSVLACHDHGGTGWEPVGWTPWQGVRDAVAQIQPLFDLKIIPSPNEEPNPENPKNPNQGSIWAAIVHKYPEKKDDV